MKAQWLLLRLIIKLVPFDILYCAWRMVVIVTILFKCWNMAVLSVTDKLRALEFFRPNQLLDEATSSSISSSTTTVSLNFQPKQKMIHCGKNNWLHCCHRCHRCHRCRRCRDCRRRHCLWCCHWRCHCCHRCRHCRRRCRHCRRRCRCRRPCRRFDERHIAYFYCCCCYLATMC